MLLHNKRDRLYGVVLNEMAGIYKGLARWDEAIECMQESAAHAREVWFLFGFCFCCFVFGCLFVFLDCDLRAATVTQGF